MIIIIYMFCLFLILFFYINKAQLLAPLSHLEEVSSSFLSSGEEEAKVEVSSQEKTIDPQQTSYRWMSALNNLTTEEDGEFLELDQSFSSRFLEALEQRKILQERINQFRTSFFEMSTQSEMQKLLSNDNLQIFKDLFDTIDEFPSEYQEKEYVYFAQGLVFLLSVVRQYKGEVELLNQLMDEIVKKISSYHKGLYLHLQKWIEMFRLIPSLSEMSQLNVDTLQASSFEELGLVQKKYMPLEEEENVELWSQAIIRAVGGIVLDFSKLPEEERDQAIVLFVQDVLNFLDSVNQVGLSAPLLFQLSTQLFFLFDSFEYSSEKISSLVMSLKCSTNLKYDLYSHIRGKHSNKESVKHHVPQDEKRIGEEGMSSIITLNEKHPHSVFKYIVMDEEQQEELKEVWGVLESLTPGVTKFYQMQELDEEGIVRIEMEKLSGETLNKRIGFADDFDEDVLDYLEFACNHIDICNDAGIIALDFKYDNVMITDEGVLKIFDFDRYVLLKNPSVEQKVGIMDMNFNGFILGRLVELSFALEPSSDFYISFFQPLFEKLQQKNRSSEPFTQEDVALVREAVQAFRLSQLKNQDIDAVFESKEGFSSDNQSFELEAGKSAFESDNEEIDESREETSFELNLDVKAEAQGLKAKERAMMQLAEQGFVFINTPNQILSQSNLEEGKSEEFRKEYSQDSIRELIGQSRQKAMISLANQGYDVTSVLANSSPQTELLQVTHLMLGLSYQQREPLSSIEKSAFLQNFYEHHVTAKTNLKFGGQVVEIEVVRRAETSPQSLAYNVYDNKTGKSKIYLDERLYHAINELKLKDEIQKERLKQMIIENEMRQLKMKTEAHLNGQELSSERQKGQMSDLDYLEAVSFLQTMLAQGLDQLHSNKELFEKFLKVVIVGQSDGAQKERIAFDKITQYLDLVAFSLDNQEFSKIENFNQAKVTLQTVMREVLMASQEDIQSQNALEEMQSAIQVLTAA